MKITVRETRTRGYIVFDPPGTSQANHFNSAYAAGTHINHSSDDFTHILVSLRVVFEQFSVSDMKRGSRLL